MLYTSECVILYLLYYSVELTLLLSLPEPPPYYSTIGHTYVPEENHPTCLTTVPKGNGQYVKMQVHAIFATLVPGFPSPYPNMGLTALAALTPEPGGCQALPPPTHLTPSWLKL